MALVRNYTDVDSQKMVDGVTARVVVGPDEGAPTFNMRVFEVSPGYSTPHHSHWWEHEVFILEGEGLVKTAQGEKSIASGTVVFVPGQEMHQFVNTSKEKVLRFICMVPQDWLGKNKEES